MSALHSLDGQAPHVVLEALAYFVAARVYWFQARHAPRPEAAFDRWRLVVCAIFGAAVGSKSLHVLEHFAALREGGSVQAWLGGKSVLGGLMGGTLGTEAGKKWVGWRQSTGDAWVPAIAAGLLIGRLGCQLSGLWDDTYGTPTTLPWGWDYGDGLSRHPVAAYEIGLVAVCWALVGRIPRRPAGVRFAAFMTGYCLIRLLLECFKPPFGGDAGAGMAVDLHVGLTAIQWAALAGLVAYPCLLMYRRGIRPPPHRPMP